MKSIENIITRFQEVVKVQPDHLAVSSREGTLSYKSLDELSGRLASEMSERMGDEKAEKKAALFFSHGSDMVVGMIGALKAGCTYVPLDSSFPQSRWLSILKDCRPDFLITDEEHLSEAYELLYKSELEMEVISFDELEDSECQPWESPDVDPDATAYILYTSGSTGKPKGVQQSHKNILQMTSSFAQNMAFASNDRLLLTTSYSHTVGAIDIFSALLQGAALSIYDIQQDLSVNELMDWIKAEKITVLHSVPTFFRHLMQRIDKTEGLDTVRLVILGGEDVYSSDFELFQQHFSDDTYFVNLYGSSEVMVCSFFVADKQTELNRQLIPVGSPVEGVEVEVLNKEGKPVQVFETGELIIKSEFITEGYHGESEQENIDKFDSDHTSFRTGDIVRLLPDGQLEYNGRADFTVKLNGNRMNLQEIELNMLKIEQVAEAVVLLDKQKNMLSAFCVAHAGEIPDVEELTEGLRMQLPEYMVPKQINFLETFPLTPNGKVDRMQLSTLNVEQEAMETHELTETEAKLMTIWEELFSLNQISRGDNFFKLGGNSLTAANMINEIYMEFGCELEMKIIFDNQTIFALARRVDEMKTLA